MGFVRCKDGTIKYRVEGRGMSGDMDTSLRNIVIMVCLFIALFIELGGRYSLLNDGDDNGTMCEEEDVAELRESAPAHFHRAGFIMEIEETVSVFEHIDFCQTHPVWDGARYIMCRDPRIVLSKDLYCIKSITNEREWNTQRLSVGQCGLSLAGNLPIFNEFYSMLCRGAGTKVDANMEETGFARLARGVEAKYAEPTAECRASFYRAFGILPELQIGLERLYRESNLLYNGDYSVFDVSFGHLLTLSGSRG
jgi:hypothetical protein